MHGCVHTCVSRTLKVNCKGQLLRTSSTLRQSLTGLDLPDSSDPQEYTSFPFSSPERIYRKKKKTDTKNLCIMYLLIINIFNCCVIISILIKRVIKHLPFESGGFFFLVLITSAPLNYLN